MYLWNNHSLLNIPEHQINDLFQGNGVFETILATNHANLLLWDRHIHRLQKGAHFLGTQLTIDIDRLHHALVQHIQQKETDTCFRLNLILLPQRNDLIVRFHPFQWPTNPVSLYATNQYFRGNSPHYQYKTLSRLENNYLLKLAQANNCDDCLIQDSHSTILETSLANIFFVRDDGVIETPIARNMPFLNGVVRQYLLDFQKELNIQCLEKTIPLDAIHQYTQAFITNGLRLIQPVSNIADWHFSHTDIAWSLKALLLSKIG